VNFPHLKILHEITLTKTLLPKKVTLKGTRD
jgi:hypothetical protein